MSVRPTRWLTLAGGLACGKSILGAGVWARAAVPRHRLQRARSPVRKDDDFIGVKGKQEASRMRLKNKCAASGEQGLTEDQRVHDGPVGGGEIIAAQLGR